MSATDGRRHDIDGLRAGAFVLLIFYHIGMFYVSWDWHVKSDYRPDWLEPMMLVVNQWRMPLIFLISGLAVHFLLGGGRPWRTGFVDFAKIRVKRLGVPLLFGMLLIVPPQAYYQALANGAIEPGYGRFMWQYFTFAPWPDGAFDGSDYGLTWNHLWYLPYLLVYSLALIPLAIALDGPLRIVRDSFARLRGLWLILLPVLILMPIGIFIFPLYPYIKHDLIGDNYAHAMYGTFFVFGYLIGRNAGLWQEFVRLRWLLLVLAGLTFTAFYLSMDMVTAQASRTLANAQIFVIYLNRWVWLLLVLGWAHYLLNRPMAWLAYARRAVFPWYVLHQSITVVAGYHLAKLSLGGPLEALLLIVATFGGCAVIVYLVERFVPVLGPLIGLVPRNPRAERCISAAVSP